jgi:drug/metabolite transporter (DMT)-like permease
LSAPAATAETSGKVSHRPSSFILALSLAAMLLIWSFNYIAGKIALRHLDPLTLASFRLVCAAIVILPFHFVRRERSPLLPERRWSLGYVFLLGLLMCINQTGFTVGLAFTSSGHSSVILACGPVIVLLLARAMKQEALTTGKMLGTALAFAGVIVLETEQGLLARSPFLTGDLLTLVGTTSFAFYVVFGKKVAPDYDSIAMNTVNLGICGLLMLPVAVWQGIHLDWRAVGWAAWAGMFYMAAFSSVVAYVLFYWALRYMTASRVTAVNYFQPVGAIVLAAIFLGERPTGHLLVGAALVVLGVYLAERGTA